MTNKTLKFLKVQLIEGTKRPSKSQNNPDNWIKSKQPGGILTGSYMVHKGIKHYHNNNICVLDIDFFKKQSEEEIKNNLFIKEFGLNFIKTFNTFTIKTQSGGFHLYFKYQKDLSTCISGQVRKGLDIDFLSDGRYIVGPDNIINNNKYSIYINKSIKKIPSKLYEFIRDTLPKRNNKNKKQNKKFINKTKNINQFSYNIDDTTFNEIVNNMPDTYFNSYTEFLKFSTFCKIINRAKEWDDISKTKPNYNKNKNIEIWNNCDTSLNMVDQFLKYTNKPKSYFKYKDVPNYTQHTPDLIINRKKLGIDNNKPVNFIQEVLDKYNDTDCIIIKSDTGTGKSTSVAQYFDKSQEDFISVVSRVSLGQEQSKKIFNERFNLNSIFYKDDIGFFDTGENVVIQLESLMRLMNMDLSDYVLFLDEYSSIIEHILTSSTLDKRRTIIFQMFIRVIKSCKLIIAVDADINSTSIEFLKSIKNNVRYIKNTFSHNKNVSAEEIETFDEIINLLKKENKFFVCTDSKSRAEKINYLLNDKSIKLITSETIEYIDLDLYDKIIISPKIIYGLDCSTPKPVYCVFQGCTISPCQMVQQIARVRNITKLNFNFINKTINQPLYSSLEECKNILQQSNNLAIMEFNLICDKTTCDFYLNYLSKVEYKLDCLRTNKFYHFIKILKDRGFNFDIKYYNNQNINKSKEKEIINEIYNSKLDNLEFYKDQVNKYLNIPDEEIKNYSELLIDKFKLLTHFNIKKMFFKHELADDIKLNIEMNDNDYPVNLTYSTNTKIYFLKSLLEKTKANGINPTVVLDNKEAVECWNKYKTIYRVRSKAYDFTKLNDINKTLNKIYKDLFKNLIETTRKGKQKKYIFNFDNDIYDYHKKLFNFKYNNNNDSDDDNDDTTSEIIKNLEI